MPRLRSLDELFADDDLKLLDKIEVQAPTLTDEDKNSEKAAPLYQFLLEKRRLPSADSSDFAEKRLAFRYSGLKKSDPELCAKLEAEAESLAKADKDAQSTVQNKAADLPEEKIYSSLDDIFSDDDDLNLLDGVDAVLELTPAPRRTAAAAPAKADDIARMEICKNFELFAPWFSRLSPLIDNGDLLLKPFKGLSFHLERGQLFINNGIYVMVAEAQTEEVKFYGSHHHYRVHIIFNNKLEQKPLNRSFIRRLASENSYQLIPATETGKYFMEKLKKFLQDPKSESYGEISGYLYILKSLSTDPVLTEFMSTSDLIKVGFCTTTVEERIKGARHTPTYLYADVEIVKTYRCRGNIDPHKVEHLVHALLAQHRLNISLTDTNGKVYKPREWFTVPAKTVIEIMRHILDGDIGDYRVDSVMGKLVPKR